MNRLIGEIFYDELDKGSNFFMVPPYGEPCVFEYDKKIIDVFRQEVIFVDVSGNTAIKVRIALEDLSGCCSNCKLFKTKEDALMYVNLGEVYE